MRLLDLEKETIDIKIVRDGEFDCIYLSGRNCNKEKDNISFVNSEKYVEAAIKDDVNCLICRPEIVDYVTSEFQGGICVSSNPKKALFEIHKFVAEKSIVCKENIIGRNVLIHPSANIDRCNVVIGDNVVIGAYTSIKSGTVIGNNVNIMDNCVIGTPAFYYYGEGDEKELVTSNGGVIIEDNVNVHNGVIIEKGVIGGNTIICRNTKIDQSTTIGHDVKIGKNCIITANIVFAGWVEVGDDSFVGITTTVAPAVTIGEKCKISIGSVVTRDVESGNQVTGNFAIEHSKFINNLKMISQ